MLIDVNKGAHGKHALIFVSSALLCSPLCAAACLLRHRLDREGLWGRTNIKERKSPDKGTDFGKVHFLNDLSLANRQLPALFS